MTTNAMIGTLNLLITLSLLALGFGLVWLARTQWRSWPVSARIALGGVFVTTGLCIGQLALFRLTALPDVVSPNGWGTLVLRTATAIVAIALARRVYTGRLLTPADRESVT